jgi:hypothetical protein
VQAKNVVTFKPGKEMEERVRDYRAPAAGSEPAEPQADDEAGTTPSEPDGA